MPAHGPIDIPRERTGEPLPASKTRSPRVNLILAREENRLPMFPSPTPMTEREKLLAQYVATTSVEVLSAASTDSTLIPELEIRPLEIAPLDTDETKPKDN